MNVRLATVVALLVMSASGLFLFSTLANDEPPILLEAETTITAGEAWTINVTVDDPPIDENTLQIDMFHGVTHYQETLILGTGGVARWEFVEGELTQAGTSLVVARIADYQATFALEVEPKEPATLIGFTTANSIAAYGEADTAIVVMAADTYGNPPDKARVDLTLTAPSGEQNITTIPMLDGLASYEFSSIGNPGLLRINLALGNISESRTLIQQPGNARNINLRLSSTCILNDGLEDITLSAQVFDSHDNPVIDGMVVSFVWVGGYSARSVINGLASVTIPPPTEAGTYTYSVLSGNISASDELLVTDSVCQ